MPGSVQVSVFYQLRGLAHRVRHAGGPHDWKRLKQGNIPSELYRLRRVVRNVIVDPKSLES
jgi:hypothetical protein